MEFLPYIIEAIICIARAGVVGALFGWNRRKATAEREIGSAEDEATRIVNEAYKSAESKKRKCFLRPRRRS